MPNNHNRRKRSAFVTHALASVARRDAKSGTTVPTEEGVQAARDFVNENQK